MSKKLVLIDGHSIANRAFYGVPMLTNSKGLHTNAIYGFLNILFKLIDEEKPDYLAVAFDLKAPTFRHKMYSEYKGTRKPMPDELREQIPVIKELVKAFGFLTCMQEGFEADDILGTLAKMAQADGLEVSLVSGDRDLLQISDTHIKIRIPKTKQGKTEIEDYYPEDVIAAYQVNPQQFIDLKALMGDTADNIPGVPKVGEKTAQALMVEYGSLDAIYEHVEEITKKAIKESLINNKDKAYLSQTLATIKTDCQLDFSYEAAQIDDIYNAKAYEMCKELGFKKMLERFKKADTQGAGIGTFTQGSEAKAGEADADMMKELPINAYQKKASEFIRIMSTSLSEVEEVFNTLNNLIAEEKIEYLALNVINEADNKTLAAVGLCYDEEKAYCIPVQGFVTADYLLEKIKRLSSKVSLATFNAKTLYSCSGDYFEYLINEDNAYPTLFDLKLAAYLINPLGNDYTVGDIALEYLNIELTDEKTLFGKLSPIEAFESDLTAGDRFCTYVTEQAYAVYAAKQMIFDRLEELRMYELYLKMELPVSFVLLDMERQGITTQKEALKEYGDKLSVGIVELEKRIYEGAGATFNINSPKQLGEILFEKMGLPGGKKTKTGYSTAADVLEKLAADVPVVADILEYRTLTKLKSTYADGLAAFIDKTGKIHSHFNQTITATGRISSTDPNLQNIPTRTELGRELRKVFTASEGNILIDADYSQIELRVLAHMSEDKKLIEAYNSGSDIHAITASQVFHLAPEEVTAADRRNAKAVNFGIVYGISSFGLSQDLSISMADAKIYIDDYFKTYPGIKTFLDSQVERAKKEGCVYTTFGRRRPVPEIAEKNFMRRAFGERVAKNSPIQGTAADIMKVAMLNTYRGLKKNNLQSKLVLQVHDELVIDALVSEVDQVKAVLKSAMENAVSYSVKLEIDMNTGFTWYDAH